MNDQETIAGLIGEYLDGSLGADGVRALSERVRAASPDDLHAIEVQIFVARALAESGRPKLSAQRVMAALPLGGKSHLVRNVNRAITRLPRVRTAVRSMQRRRRVARVLPLAAAVASVALAAVVLFRSAAHHESNNEPRSKHPRMAETTHRGAHTQSEVPSVEPATGNAEGVDEDVRNHGGIEGPTLDGRGRQGVRAGEDFSTLLSFDFEDGRRPPGFRVAEIAPGPPRQGNRFAAVASEAEYARSLLSVIWSGVEASLTFGYRDTLVATFDYYAGEDAASLKVQTWNTAKRFHSHLVFTDFPRGKWTHAVVRFVDLVPRGLLQSDEGDPMNSLGVVGGKAGGAPLIIDNLKLLDYAPAALPAASTLSALPSADD